MTTLPILGYVANAARTQGEMQSALEATNTFIRDKFGSESLAFYALTAAATTNLAAMTSEYGTLTGTATITSFGALPSGVVRHVRVISGGALITHDGTSLICPGAGNITTVTGDYFEVLGLGSSNVAIINYQSARIGIGGDGLLRSGTVASVATLDLPLPTGYKRFNLKLDRLIPATNNVSPNIVLSIDGAVTWKSTSYQWAGNYTTTAAGVGAYDSSTGGTGAILMTAAGVSNSAGTAASHEIEIYPGMASACPVLTGESFTLISGGASNSRFEWGANLGFNGPLTNIRILFGSGNIATCDYALYGVS